MYSHQEEAMRVIPETTTLGTTQLKENLKYR